MVGFCDVAMMTTGGQELAKGSHIKYLPMGSLWDFIFGPLLLPCTLYLLNNLPLWLKTMMAPNFKHTGPATRNTISIFEEIGISRDSKSDTFKVKPNLCNPTGHLHGGALAVACEASILGMPEAEGKSIKSMNIKYLRTMKGTISIHSKVDGDTCLSEVKDSKGNLCAQFSCKLTPV